MSVNRPLLAFSVMLFLFSLFIFGWRQISQPVELCYGGVTYLQFVIGFNYSTTPKFQPDGKVMTCNNK